MNKCIPQTRHVLLNSTGLSLCRLHRAHRLAVSARVSSMWRRQFKGFPLGTSCLSSISWRAHVFLHKCCSFWSVSQSADRLSLPQSVCLSVSLTVPMSAVCRLHLTAMNFSAFQHFHRKLLDKNGKHNCHRRSKRAGERGREHI